MLPPSVLLLSLLLLSRRGSLWPSPSACGRLPQSRTAPSRSHQRTRANARWLCPCHPRFGGVVTRSGKRHAPVAARRLGRVRTASRWSQGTQQCFTLVQFATLDRSWRQAMEIMIWLPLRAASGDGGGWYD